ncbi:hypothetical protein BDBG_16931 [Blastomyces gilchristii SLH14081]|uniref:Uncharacterized protein n=1 Tax=Blastomyces gilchristii (strain SLH14081) TaxID=559298 RepID=A0A179UL89_BLAGS|nr:uncharacterized protein BDBG_16931 [Blastomyces gilchristii SLH14081]OAT07989.1 hypothetical protein BDBG_16931 [Blastomyces gilchristii SLH14081]
MTAYPVKSRQHGPQVSGSGKRHPGQNLCRTGGFSTLKDGIAYWTLTPMLQLADLSLKLADLLVFPNQLCTVLDF